MKNNISNDFITIKYKSDNEAKQRLITFLLDYYLSKEVLRKVDNNDSIIQRKPNK